MKDSRKNLSDCCAADVYEDHMICSECNDHCGYQEEDELVEEAKDDIRCAKHYKAKPNTIRGLEAEYKGIKTK